MFNDFRGFTAKGEKIHIAAPPTLLISAIGVIENSLNAESMDFKREGDAVYVVGKTNDELGGSEYFHMLSENAGKKTLGSTVPKTNLQSNLKTYDAFEKVMRSGAVASALAIGRGGLGAALGKAAIAGKLGASIELSPLKLPADTALFSESTGRFLVSVRHGKENEFEKAMGKAVQRIGTVGGTTLDIVVGKTRSSNPIAQLDAAYKKTFANL